MTQMMHFGSGMHAAVNSEAAFSCANFANNTAMLLDTMTMVSILFAILGLRLCTLISSLLGLLGIGERKTVSFFTAS